VAGARLPATLLVRRLLNHSPESNRTTMDATGSQTTGGNVEAEAQSVSLRYVKNMGMINRLAAGYGVEAWFVWQPVPTYKYDTQQHLFATGIGAHWKSKVIYEHMAEMRGVLPFPPNFLWCADIQEGLQEPLYVDAVHYTRDMSRRLAAEIASQMLARRNQAAPTGQGR
jgi:hypothetical protein